VSVDASAAEIARVYKIGAGPHFGSGLTIDTAAERYENKADRVESE
jgi:hypothetical protein